MIWWIAVPAAAVVLAVLLGRRLPRRALQVLAVLCLVIGLVSAVALEWRYSTDNTIVATMPVSLDHAGAVVTPRFAVSVPGPYEIWLAFDHGGQTTEFDCLAGLAVNLAEC